MATLLEGRTRSQIMADARTALIAAATSAGSRVYVSRSDAGHDVEMPMLAVYCDRESDSVVVQGQTGLCTPELARETELVIVALADGASDALADAAIDGLVEQVRAALLGDTAALPGIDEITPVSVEYRIATGDSAEYAMSARIVMMLRQARVQYG